MPDAVLGASSFQLVDGKGRKRGEFAIGKDGEPSLQLFDGSGFACLTIGVLDDRAGIAIAGPERENKRATTLLGVNGTTPQISLTSGSGGATIFVSVEEGKSPRVQLIKTGHKGEAQYSTYATLNVVEEGSLLMLAPVHQVTPGGVEDPAENTLLAGRIDFDVQKYGIKVFGKDNSSHSEWPPKK